MSQSEIFWFHCKNKNRPTHHNAILCQRIETALCIVANSIILPPSPRNARPTTNCLSRRRRDLDLWPFDLILPKLAEQFITHLIQFKLSSFNAMVYGDKMVPKVEF